MSIRDLPPLAQLRAFAALAEAGSMSSAGDLLNVSHAAISQQVRALEAHLGLSLVIKDGRGVQLTSEGMRLGTTLKDNFSGITQEIQSLTGADADRPLQLTTTPMFAAAWLMPRLGSFRAAYPDIDLVLNPTASNLVIEPGGVDLAIRFGKGNWPGLEAELLVRTDFVIAGSRSLIGDLKITEPSELLDFPWLQEIGTTETNDWLKQRGIVGSKVKSMTNVPGNLLLEGLRTGQGVAATSRTFIAHDLARGDVIELFTGDHLGHGYFIVSRPGVMRSKVKSFATWLRKEAKQETTHAQL